MGIRDAALPLARLRTALFLWRSRPLRLSGAALAVAMLSLLAGGLMGGCSPAAAQSCPGGISGTVRCVAAGTTQDILAFGVCRRVTNTVGLAIMMPVGTETDWRTAYGNGGQVARFDACYTYAWTDWSGWSGCSASCGGGSQSRTRSCQRSETGVGGSVTVDPGSCGGGPATDSQSCNTHSCCTPSARVVGYGGCSAGCGGGSQDVYWSDGCGGSWTSSQSCNTHSCCSSNWGGRCTVNWCQGTNGVSCALWDATDSTCDRPYGGRITSCVDGGSICCARDDGHTQCDGSCQ